MLVSHSQSGQFKAQYLTCRGGSFRYASGARMKRAGASDLLVEDRQNRRPGPGRIVLPTTDRRRCALVVHDLALFVLAVLAMAVALAARKRGDVPAH